MDDLLNYQYALIALVFIWSGFVRSGLGFGGAVLSLPFLLLITDRPLVFLPIIAGHLLFFSSLTLWQSRRQRATEGAQVGGVDWPYLRKILAIMIVPKMIGVFGLITMPAHIMSGIIFTIVAVYACGYILNRPFQSNSRGLDAIFLILGAYISGTSLIGAPLIIAVVAGRIAKQQLRDSLFALWFILVSIKVAAFIYADIDLQLIHHLWLLPAAGLGHYIGLRFHQRMLQAETSTFFRLLGSVLLLISLIGLWQISNGC